MSVHLSSFSDEDLESGQWGTKKKLNTDLNLPDNYFAGRYDQQPQNLTKIHPAPPEFAIHVQSEENMKSEDVLGYDVFLKQMSVEREEDKLSFTNSALIIKKKSSGQKSDEEQSEPDEDYSESDKEDDDEEYINEDSSAKQLPKVFHKNREPLEVRTKIDCKETLHSMGGFKGSLANRLLQYQYDGRQIRVLLEKCKIYSLEQAVDYLTKDANGWSHPYIEIANKKCEICREGKELHKHSDDRKFKQLWNQEDKSLADEVCGICYQTIPEDELILLRCGHMYCEQCLQEFIKFQITNGKVSLLICPWTDCQQELSVKLMSKHLMSNDIYEKYIKFMNRQEIHRSSNLKGCPTADCEGFLEKPILNEMIVKCKTCQKEYCFNCLHDCHQGLTCDEILEKDFEEWAGPNQDIAICKHCNIRIEKDGGCPNMTCFFCKQEWCWTCKQDFPVHNPDCPYYHRYLEILEFQGLNTELTPNGWFSYSGNGSPALYVASLLFLIIIALPAIILINMLLSPCYSLMMIASCCNVDRDSYKKWWQIIIIIFMMILLYVSIPAIFFIITVPQIFIFAVKKSLEMKDLFKNRCRRYRKLGVSPIMNKWFEKVGIR